MSTARGSTKPLRAARLAGTALLAAAVGALILGIPAAAKNEAPKVRQLQAKTSPAGTARLAVSSWTINLCAKTNSAWTIVDSTTVPIWGFALDEGAAGCSDDTAQLPGPVLGIDTPTITAGDTLTINLTNVNVPEKVSVLIPGIPSDELMPDTAGTASSKSYTFTVDDPGSYLYQSGVQSAAAQVGVQMGLYGALVVRAAPGQAYAQSWTAYDSQEVLVLSEIDPALNEDPDGSNCALETPPQPPNCHLRDYAPKYWVINGKAYPDTDPISAVSGDRLLLRYLNAGSINHSMELLGAHQRVIAKDAFPGYPYYVVTETIASGQTVDAITTPCAVGTPPDTELPLSNSNMRLTNGNASPGGMLTFVNLTGSACPSASNMAPLVDAGPNQTSAGPNAVLDGTVWDDFVSPVDVMWTMQSGPGTVTFADPIDVDTTASFSLAGAYVLELEADDGANPSVSDTVMITLANSPPVVDAGPNQTITFPGSAGLNGTVTDDGITPVTLEWTKQSGPGTVTFAPNPNVEDPTASFSASGVYILELTADDGVNAPVSDTVTITVNPTPIHVGDLDGSSTALPSNRWRAFVTITVHNGTHALVSGALVTGTWSLAGDGTATLSCTTNGTGTCQVHSGSLPKAGTPNVRFTVTGVTRANSTYASGANHDPDKGAQASNGTSKTVKRP